MTEVQEQITKVLEEISCLRKASCIPCVWFLEDGPDIVCFLMTDGKVIWRLSNSHHSSTKIFDSHKISFEEMLGMSPDKIKEELLFHLDIFTAE